MTKHEVVKVLAKRHNMTQGAIAELLGGYFDLICEVLLEEGRFEIRKFGRFEVKKRAERKFRIPSTGELKTVPECHRVAFRCGTELKKRVSQLKDEQI